MNFFFCNLLSVEKVDTELEQISNVSGGTANAKSDVAFYL